MFEAPPRRESSVLPRRRSPVSRTVDAALGIAFLAWAAFYLVSALFAIANFGWRQPMFDQWRTYQTLLGEPFPRNVLALENGHRPIIPNLIRLADVDWFSANQLLQIGIGIGCALASVLLIVAVVWRDRTLPLFARAAATMLAVLGIFWLANSRMLMHGHEALHSYLLVLAIVCAALSTYRAQGASPVRWMFVASVCGGVAMFCFGPGVACFPAAIMLGILLRIPYRFLAIPTVVLIVCLFVYLFALPGNEGVRGMLAFEPWTSVKLSMGWLSSPWATGWLSLADPPLYPQVATSFLQNSIGSVLVKTANALVVSSHLPWRTLSMLVGFAGTLLFAARILYIFIKRRPLSILQSLAVMLCLFALATAAVIGIGRADYFAVYPDQLFADRYLIWPCLFWCGFALLLLLDACTAKPRWVTAAYCAFLFALPVALLPAQSNTAGWASAVYRRGEMLAAAAQSDVIDPQAIEGNADSIELYRATETLLRERDLAMFSDRSWQLLNSRWSGSLHRDDGIAVDMQAMVRVDASPAGRIDGVIAHGVDLLPRDGELALLDDGDRIAGFARFDSLGPGTRALIFSSPRKRGFDGYVSVLDSRAHYRLAWLDPKSNRGIVLAEVPR